MDGGVPVEAAVERRRQLARRPGVGVGVHHVGDLVRVLPVDAVEREARKAAGRRFVEAVRLAGVRGDGEGKGEEERKGQGASKHARL